MKEIEKMIGFTYKLKPTELVFIAKNIASTGDFGIPADTLKLVAHYFLKEGMHQRDIEIKYPQMINSTEFLNAVNKQAQMFL